MKSKIEIRKITTIPELRQVEKLDAIVWKGHAVPLHQTLTASQNGGLVIGAFADDMLVGFSYSFPGFADGNIYLCSHMLGIHPDFQKQGIGLRLKMKQKEEALKLGYTMLSWTYDPLESVNAYLNLSKLGAISHIYVENCYGEMSDSLNEGLPTDRLNVHWHIAKPQAESASTWNTDDFPVIVDWTSSEAEFPVLIEQTKWDLLKTENTILLPIPNNFQQIKKEDLRLAIDWRFRTRHIFQKAFQQGFVAVHLIRKEEGPVHFYVLVKK